MNHWFEVVKEYTWILAAWILAAWKGPVNILKATWRKGMSTFRVRLTGQNVQIDGDEGPKKRRFFATRIV